MDARVVVPGGLGLAQHVDPNALGHDQGVLSLVNADFRKDGCWSKRYGRTALTSTSSGKRVFYYDNELLYSNQASLCSYDFSASLWRVKGYVGEFTAWHESVVASSNLTGFSSKDIAYANGFVAVAYIGVSGVSGSTVARMTIYEAATGQHVAEAESTTTSVSSVRCLAVGNNFVMVYGTSTDTYQVYVPSSTWTAARRPRTSSCSPPARGRYGG